MADLCSLRRLTIALVVVLLALGLFAPAASAHAHLHGATPEEGDRLEAVPDELELEFTGDGIELAEVTVRGPNGEDVSGEATVDQNDRRIVHAPLSDAGEGAYVVEWEVLSDDGHTTSGAYVFTVGDEEVDRETLLATYDEDEEEVSALAAGSKGLVLLSLVGLVGVPVTLWIGVYPVVGGQPTRLDAADRRASRLLAGAGAALLAGVVGLGIARGASFGDAVSAASLVRFLGTSLGGLWLVQLGIAAVVVGVLLAARRWSLSRRRWLLTAAFGGLAVQLTISWSSHSATLLGRLEGTVIDFVHIAGAAFWLGGLAVLAVVLPAVLQAAPASERRAIAASVVSRFSIVALAGVTLALITGMLLASWHVPDLESLSETVYGTALSAKTVLVALALGVGGATRFVLLRRLRTDERGGGRLLERLGGVGSGARGSDREVREDGGTRMAADVRAVVGAIRLEVAVLVLVILLSGLVTSVPTAALMGVEDPHDGATLESELDEVDMTVTVVPAYEALDRAHVTEDEPAVIDVVFERDGERIAVDDGVSILFENDRHDDAFRVELEETDGAYSTIQALPEPEFWDARVTASIEGDEVSERVELYAIPADHDHGDHDHDHVGVADGPLAPWLRLGAVGIGLVGTVAIALETIRFERLQRRE